jgi:hypothetical protein
VVFIGAAFGWSVLRNRRDARVAEEPEKDPALSAPRS